MQTLRNSLEHLIEAELRWDSAVPTAARAPRWAIDGSPSGSLPLHFDLRMVDSIFGLVDLDVAIHRALPVFEEMTPVQRAGAAFIPRLEPPRFDLRSAVSRERALPLQRTGSFPTTSSD